MKVALKVLGMIAAAFAMFVAWALLRTPSPEEQERSAERMAIELCWKDQARKSLDASTARFIAGACEMMESDFKAKHRLSP